MATVTGSRAAPSAQDISASHPYTCNTCQVAFRNSDLQKGHMRNDWHRYNLKRRVATLPPISSEVFTEKVLQARASTTAEAERAGFQTECGLCHKTYFSENSYQNHIGSQKHKAKAAAQLRKGRNGVPADDASSMISSTFSLGEPVASTTSEVDSDAEEEFSYIVEGMKKTGISEQKRPSPVKRPSNPQVPARAQHPEDHSISEASSEQQSVTPTPLKAADGAQAALTLKHCLFCNHESPDVPMNVSHMEKTHGMFIPEKQYLVDMDGLLRSLQERIQEYHECLVCGKAKANAYAAQTHMRDTGHCKIPYTTEDEQLEIGEFYDFRSTYSDDEMDDDESDEGESPQAGGVKLGGKRAAVTTNEDGEEIEEAEDAGWETDSSASSLDSADLTAVPAENHYHQYERLEKHAHHSRSDSSRPHRQKDGFHSHSHKPTRAVFYDEYELHLPSGRSVGHRSLNKYYRQNLRERPFLEGYQQHQLTLEDGDPDAMDVDGEEGNNGQQVVLSGRVRDQRRQLVGRGAEGGGGMLGVSDKKRKEVGKAAQRSRKVQHAHQKRNEWSVNKQANHQKHYHYSIL